MRNDWLPRLDKCTAAACEALKAAGHAELIQSRTGLVLDAYFSATKLAWLLDNVPGARQRAEAGELAFGTVDSWLIHRLSGGQAHVTDVSNASRTMLYDIRKQTWDKEILDKLRIPASMLPTVKASSEVYAETAPDLLGAPIPIAGIAGDQQAALFGQACFKPGMMKNTYGTGCFLLMNTGEQATASKTGLLTTIAWRNGGVTEYALEGSVFIAGAAVQWLRDGLGLITNASTPMWLRDTELEEVGLLHYFSDCRLSAVDVGYLKPHPAIFQHALDKLQLQPSEVVFVGDNPEADVSGAQSVGMKAVLRVVQKPGIITSRLFTPDARIDTFHELPAILDEWYPGWR